jgi:hypothetical protein
MKTFSDTLAALKHAQCWYWHDDCSRGASLSITIDNLPADRRQCYEVRIPRETSRRGEKALRQWIREIAVILKGVPCPQFLSYTEWSDAPRIAEARESAAYLSRISSRQ